METVQIILNSLGASDVQGMFAKPGFDETCEIMWPCMVKDASAAAESARDAGADLGTSGEVVRLHAASMRVN